MRFGVFVPQGWKLDLAGVPVTEQWGRMLGFVRTAEDSGFDSVWVVDHFHTVPEPTQEPTYEAWALIAALAGATDRIRLGQMCTCISYRMPAYLAHVAASIDVISGGRLDLGIGAGWYEQEHFAHGYDFPIPSVRIGQLDEGVEIMRRMWTEDKATFRGDHYRIEEAICRPRPIQQPHIPIWIAGGGEKRTLRVAARHASYTNFGDTPEEFAHKSKVLESHCADVGRDYGEITRSFSLVAVCAPTEAEALERFDEVVARMRALVSDQDRLDQYVAEARRCSGPPDKIVEVIRPYVASGMDYLLVRFPDAAYDTSGAELFAREVVGSFD
ncbi:MAG: LLM class F420-dependent oxidoreductase [Acidimicrobiia bacterium]